MKRVPVGFQSALWSYDIKEIDANKAYKLVITQLINYGGIDGENWILSNYPSEKIKEVVSDPSRGTWQRGLLRKWLNRFDITIDPLNFEMAILNMHSPSSLVELYWKRKLGGKYNNNSKN